MGNPSEKPKSKKKTRPSKEPDPTQEELTAWADRIIGVWDMTSDFAGYLSKVGVRMCFVLLMMDDKPVIFAHPRLSKESIEKMLEILGKGRKRYAQRAFDIAQSAPAYSAIKQLEKMMGGKEQP